MEDRSGTVGGGGRGPRVAVLAVVGVLLAGCGGQPLAGPPPAEATAVASPVPTEAAAAASPAPTDSAPPAKPPAPDHLAGSGGVPAATVADGKVSDLGPVKRFRSVRGHEESPVPTDVRIPAIGVASSLEHVGRDAEGSVEAPGVWQRAGWFTEGARPGQRGPAVILGHVDSKAGPAVFYRLHELRPGDEIAVDRADGSTVTFVIERVERHAKDDFPTRAVYFPTLEPTLRLVTCGGVFDRRAGSYRDNIVVFATQAD